MNFQAWPYHSEKFSRRDGSQLHSLASQRKTENFQSSIDNRHAGQHRILREVSLEVREIGRDLPAEPKAFLFPFDHPLREPENFMWLDHRSSLLSFESGEQV